LRCALLALVLCGCVTDVAIALELRLPRAPDGSPDVPPDVRAHEVRLYRVDQGEGCPDLTTAATAESFATFAHAQAFDDGMGDAIGELPRGTWAIVAISRDEACAPRLFGCTEIEIADAPDTIVVELAPVAADSMCGCRTCEAGICAPIDEICR
jgi:hypothetical protein